jgi:YbgC/YbaW family acyl-CoA thioester hydrolase
MPSEHVIRRRVEFVETDMAGIVHFSRFFNYMEAAEHDFFRSLGHSVVTDLDGDLYGWPRVHAECDWRAPLRFEDEFEVRLLVRDVRKRSIELAFVIHRIEGERRTLVGHGAFTTVCVAPRSGGGYGAVEIPAAIRDLLTPVSPQRLAELIPPRNGL